MTLANVSPSAATSKSEPARETSDPTARAGGLGCESVPAALCRTSDRYSVIDSLHGFVYCGVRLAHRALVAEPVNLPNAAET
jgi:hypothetical protein